jgi:DNA-binding transcriptional MocR family regulator
VWVPVSEEVPVVQGLIARGWAVQPGEPYRIDAEPAIRVTTAGLAPADARRLADDLADVLDNRLGTRRG